MRLQHFLAWLTHQPGALGIAVLLALTPVSIFVAVAHARDRVNCHAMALGMVSVVFWLWAVYKCAVLGDQDFGALSFAIVLIACCCVFNFDPRAARDAKVKRASSALCRLCFACAAVCANYAFVLHQMAPGERVFSLYLGFGALWWGCATVWTWSALFSHMKSLKNSEVDLEAEALVEASELEEHSVFARARVLLSQ